MAKEEAQGMTTEDVKTGFLQQFAGIARNIMAILAVFGVVWIAAKTIAEPWVQPYVDMPKALEEARIEMAEARSDLHELKRQFSARFDLRILDFMGNGIIVEGNKVQPGQSVTVFYMLRRNVSCDTQIIRNLYNVNTGTTIQAGQVMAIKASVTRRYQGFRVAFEIPRNVRPGTYLYTPIARPIECGEYGEITLPPSMPFEVVAEG